MKKEAFEFVTIFVSGLATFFAPAYGIVCALIFATIVDFVIGLWKAKKKKEKLSPLYGFWSTFVKSGIYSLIVFSVLAIDRTALNDLVVALVGKPEISYLATKIAALVLFAIEIVSMNRNYREVKGVSMFDALTKVLTGVKKTATNIKHIREEVKETEA